MSVSFFGSCAYTKSTLMLFGFQKIDINNNEVIDFKTFKAFYENLMNHQTVSDRFIGIRLIDSLAPTDNLDCIICPFTHIGSPVFLYIIKR